MTKKGSSSHLGFTFGPLTEILHAFWIGKKQQLLGLFAPYICVSAAVSLFFFFFNWATLHPFVHPTDGRSLFPLAAIPEKDPLCLANETLVQLMNHAIGLRTSQMSPLTNTMLLQHYWPSPDYSASLLTTFSFVLNTKSSHIVPLQYFNTSIMRPFRQ